MYYREDVKGQILEEGISEAGSMASWIGRGDRLQQLRNADDPVLHLLLDVRLPAGRRSGLGRRRPCRRAASSLGGTAGRTTLAVRDLQHQDGHSHILASTIPNCVSYDPTYGYELAVIIHDGLRRMHVDQENVFYYLTVMNENYVQPALPERGRCEGGHPARDVPAAGGQGEGQDAGSAARARAPSFARSIAAASLLQDDFGVASDVWSVTSFTELRRDGMDG